MSSQVRPGNVANRPYGSGESGYCTYKTNKQKDKETLLVHTVGTDITD